jgi:hypothetical protein
MSVTSGELILRGFTRSVVVTTDFSQNLLVTIEIQASSSLRDVDLVDGFARPYESLID